MNSGGAARSSNVVAWLLGCWLPMVVLSSPALAAETSKNPHIPVALRLYEAFEYEEALLTLEKADRWPANTVEDKVSIALLEGVLAFETQKPERGKKAFERAVSLDRSAKLTLPVSPKVAAVLEEARESRRPMDPILPPTEVIAQSQVSEPIQVESHGRPNLKLPVAIGGGVVALGGLLALGKAESLESKVRKADPTIDSRAALEDTLQQGRTFEKVGWALMGLGAAATAGSLLFLDSSPAQGTQATITPISQGAHLSVRWSLP